MKADATVAVYDVRSDADIAVLRLAADGIDARISDDSEGGLNPGFFATYGVRVIVRARDVDDAYVSLGIERVSVPAQVADAMFKHAGWAYPNEACGLIGIDDTGVPAFVMCLSNGDAAPDRFTISPDEHFGANRFAEGRSLVVGAVFHSHPTSDAYPSRADIEGGADPDWLHFIIGPVSGRKPLIRCFRIRDGFVTEVKVTVEQ